MESRQSQGLPTPGLPSGEPFGVPSFEGMTVVVQRSPFVGMTNKRGRGLMQSSWQKGERREWSISRIRNT